MIKAACFWPVLISNLRVKFLPRRQGNVSHKGTKTQRDQEIIELVNHKVIHEFLRVFVAKLVWLIRVRL
jgi:hypothetical protein